MGCTFKNKTKKTYHYKFDFTYVPEWVGPSGDDRDQQQSLIRNSVAKSCGVDKLDDFDLDDHRHGKNKKTSEVEFDVTFPLNSNASVPGCVEQGIVAAGGPKTPCFDKDD